MHDGNENITCANMGVHFYDTGGSGGNYQDDEDFTLTFTPPAGMQIEVTLNSCNIENFWDGMDVHNGPNIFSPLIITLSGVYLPGGKIRSTAAGGELTFHFTSDFIINRPGWDFTVNLIAVMGGSGNQNISSCCGRIYDPGWLNNYFTNQSSTMTISPPAGSCSNVNMTFVNDVGSFVWAECCCDRINLHNGPNNGSPQLGSFQSCSQPNATPYVSTDPTGALTLDWRSDVSIVDRGFQIDLSCTPKPALTVTATAVPPDICSGGTSVLTATSNRTATYLWNPGGLPGSPVNVTPAATTTYTVTATEAATGCTATATTTVTVVPTPAIPVINTNTSPLCFGATGAVYSINAVPNATTYNWTIPGTANLVSGQGTTSITVDWLTTPAGPTTITVEAINVGSVTCTGPTLTFNITINPLPTITTNPTTVTRCDSDPPSQLNASGGVSYAWSPAAGLSATNISNPTANPFATTTYTVTGTDANGCTGTATVLVTISPNPVVIANPVTVTRCTTDPPSQLSASGATTYTWSPVAGLSDPNIANPTANPPTTTTYTVTGTTGGCTGTASVVVTVNPAPTITINPATATICATDPPVTFTAAGGTSYVWSSGDVTAAISVNPGVTTTYTVTGTDGNGCTNTASAVLTVTPNPPTPTPLQVTTPVCPDQLATVYNVVNVPGTTYTWTVPVQATLVSGQNTNSIVVNWRDGVNVPTPPGSYNITVSATANGCNSITPLTMAVTVQNPPPGQPSAPTGPTPICKGTLGNYSVTNDPAATSYNWTGLPPGAFISNGINTNSITINWGAAAAGTYTISVTASNSCGTSPLNSMIVDVIDVRPQPSVITPPANICVGQTATFSVVNDADPSVTGYTWTNSCGWTGTSTTNSIDYTPTAGGPCVITVVVNNTCGVSAPRSLVVTPKDVPAQPLPITGPTAVCPNQIETYNVPNIPGLTYTWNALPAGASYVSGQGTNQVRINWGTATPQTFSLTVTPSNVCGNGTAQSIDVVIGDVPGALAGINGTTNLCAGQSGEYSIITPPGNTSFAWSISPAGPSLSPNGSNATVVFPAAGVFTITVTPSNSCGVGLTPSTINVTIIAPTVINTQPIVSSCTPTTSLTATPAGGTWACASCPGGATIDNAGNVSGMNNPGGNYVFSYTVNNPPCASATSFVTVKYDAAVGGSVGSAATICSGGSGTVNLSGQSGTVQRWERSTDCITFTPIVNVSNSYTYINLTQTTCFRAVVSRGNCPEVTSNSVAITVVSRITPTASPATQSVCVPNATVTGVLPPLTTGTWSFVTGPTVATITTNVGTGTINGMTVVGTYTFRWTVNNPPCPPTSVDVTVTRTPPLTVPNAGVDQNICSARATLVGNIPVVGTGVWSYVSGPSGTPPNIQPVNQNIGIVSGMTTPGLYIFRYTISNAFCGSLTDDVEITVGTPPSAAAAGTDQIVCDPTAIVMGNNPPIVGTGTWSFVTGPTAASISQLNNIGNITGMSIPGDYYFRYTISNPPCPFTSDDVKITVINQPSQAAVAQTVYNLCDAQGVTLRALRPQYGTGTWAFVSGPSTPTVNSQGTDGIVTGLTAIGTYKFSWTVTNLPCAGTSTVEVEVNRETPITDNISAGPNQVLCNVTTTTLNSPTPIPPRSTGTWVYVSGPVANVTVTTNGTQGNVINMDIPGTYAFEWRVQRTTGNCPGVSAGLIVEIKPSPTVANAGPDQTICGTTATLSGNVPSVGTPTWTQVSGPSASIVPNNNVAMVSGMNTSGTYVFRYTISNAPCTPSTDDVTINVSTTPVPGFVASDATVCAGTNSGTLTLSGNSGNIIRWESSTNNFGTFAVIGNVTNTLAYTNLTTTTSYRAVLKNGVCPEVTSGVATITVSQQPTVANAGADKNFCASVSSTNLIGNTPTFGTGTWTFQSGPTTPSFNVSGNIVNVFGIIMPGTYTFCYTISNPPCTPSQDCASIIVSPQSIGGTVVSSATVCMGANGGTLTLTGNNGNVLRWEYSEDMVNWIPVNNVTSTQNYSNLTTTRTYRAVSQSGSCPIANSVGATITVSQPPSVANAGPDQSFCGNVTSATLTGNLPVNGTGSWSYISGPPSTPNVTSNNNVAQITGMNNDGTYTFRYTISNPPCTPTTDDVTVTRYTSTIGGVLVNAATVCAGSNSGTLSVSGFNGSVIRWESSTDGFNGNITQISNPSSTYSYSGLTTTTSFRVVSQAGACSEATSNIVTITVQPTTPPANGGPGQTVCTSYATLNAMLPNIGTGTWSFITGPSPAIIVTNGALGDITGMSSTGTYTFRWTVNNPPCAPTTADVIVARLPDGVVANAGADVTTCNTSVTLNGNSPAPGTGAWSQVSGPGSSIFTSGTQGIVSGMNVPGTYIYRWTITNSPCPVSTDDVVVTVLQGPSPAQVGAQSVIVCDVNIATLNAVTPVSGTGSWSFVSGPVVASISGSPVGNVTGMTTNGTYVFRWTVTNPPCSQINTVDVVVTRQTGLGVNAFAGANQFVCNNQFALVVGNQPPLGSTGQWAFINGPAIANITTVGNFGSITSMSVPGSYVFSWTITPTNGCPPSTSMVTVTRVSPPTPATAGPISTICGNSTILTGNTPVDGTGSWSFISGPMNPTLNASGTSATITNMDMTGVYVFRWTISNAPCTPSAFDVPVTVFAPTQSGTLNGGATVCSGSNSGTLNLSGYEGSIARWEISTDNFNTFTAINNVSPNLPFNNVTVTTCYRAIVKNGTCPEAASNIVCVNIVPPVTIANGGSNQAICGSTVTLTGNMPISGVPTWSFVSGPVTPSVVSSNNTGIVSGMTAGGVYTFKYLIDNSPCGTSESLVFVTVNSGSVGGSAGPNKTVCAGNNSGNIVLSGHTGNVVRWETSTDGGITWQPIANTTTIFSFSNLTGTIICRGVVKDGNCSEAFSSPATITVNPIVVANAGSAQSICGSTTATVTGNNPMTGTGTWSFISGPAVAAISTNGTTGNITGMTVGGTYVFRWTISNPPCATSTSDVSITTSPTTVGGSVSMDMTVCGGINSATLVLTGSVGNVLRWESSVDNFVSSTINHLNPTVQHTYVNLTQTTWFRAIVQSGSCQSEISGAAKITVVPPTTPANAGNSQTVCSTNATLTGNIPASGTTSWVFVTGPGSAQVTTNGNIGIVTGMNVPGNYIFRYTITNPPCASSSANVQVTVLTPINAGNVTGAATVCASANSGNVVLAGNGGPVIRWESSIDMGGSWNPIGNTGNTQGYTNLTQTTWFRAVINAGTCGAIFTNPVEITVNPVSLGGNISSPATVCSGNNSGTLTLAGNVGSVTKWQMSTDGINFTDIINQTLTQNYSNLTQTTFYRAEVKSGICSAVFTTSVQISVTPASSGGAVANNTSVCSGSNNVTLTLSGNVGSVDHWEASNDGITWTTIVNQTLSQTFTNLTQTTIVRAAVQNANCGLVFSTPATITVSTPTVAGTLGSPATVCGGNNNGILNITGNTGSVIRWEVSVNGNPFTSINNQNLSHTYSNLTQTSIFRAVIQNGGCASALTNEVTITVDQGSNGGVISGGTEVCIGVNSGTLTLSGQNGSILRWESSFDGVNFTPINNTTPILTFANLNQTTIYRAVVSSQFCGGQVFSQTATVNVSQPSVAGFINGNIGSCGGTANGVMTLSNFQGSIIRWESSTDNVNFFPINNSQSSTLSYSVSVTTYYRVIVQNGSCPSAITPSASVVVSPFSVGGTLSSSANVCSGNNNGTITLSGNVGNVIDWQASTDGGITFQSIGNQSNSYNYSNLTQTTIYRAVVQNGVCSSVNSSTVTITVLNNLAVMAQAVVGCNGQANVYARATGGSGSYVYSISPQVQSDNDNGDFTNIPQGTYTITVNDGTGCTAITSVVVGNGPTAPIINPVTNITRNTAFVTWPAVPPGAGVFYTLRYRILNTQNWTQISNISNTFQLLQNLQNNTTYEVQLAFRCGSNGPLSPFSTGLVDRFTTQSMGTCSDNTVPVPGGVYVDQITATTAVVNWNLVQGAAGYIIAYGPLSQNPNSWTQEVVCNPQNSFLMFNLQRNTNYGVRIRTNCSNCTTALNNNDRRSVWTISINFATPSARDYDEINTTSDVVVYPNPNKGNFNVNFSSNVSEDVTIQIIDVTGKEVLSRVTVSEIGENSIPVELNGYSSGVYMLNVVVGSERKTIKMIVE